MSFSAAGPMRFMTLRAFLRGGYQTITAPTMIVKRGLPLFTVMPHGKGPALDTKVVTAYEEGRVSTS